MLCSKRAAARLNVSLTTFRLYCSKFPDRLKPDGVLGRSNLYHTARIDAFKEWMGNRRKRLFYDETGNRLYTVRQVAEKVGVTPTAIYYHVGTTKILVPTARRMGQNVFSDDAIQAFLLKWKGKLAYDVDF